jgi:hypothetical protein
MAFVLGTDSPPPAPALPRSSIAAVLDQRVELGLTAVQVKQLEDRDAALQKQFADIRARAAPAGRARGTGGLPATQPPSAGDGAAPAATPNDSPSPSGSGAGSHRGSGMGRHARNGTGQGSGQEPTSRTASLQTQLDDADTAAWLGVEPLLPEALRDKARAFAEKYREALADEQLAHTAAH